MKKRRERENFSERKPSMNLRERVRTKVHHHHHHHHLTHHIDKLASFAHSHTQHKNKTKQK
jgi:hypothetical protein